MKKILFWLCILSLVILSSCGKQNSSDIINPDARFLYFYGATCPHCQELNKKVEEQDLFSFITVEKREVYYNNTNREIFLGVAEKVGAEDPGVPFVVDRTTGEYAVGVTPALELFKKWLIPAQIDTAVSSWEVLESSSETETLTGAAQSATWSESSPLPETN